MFVCMNVKNNAGWSLITNGRSALYEREHNGISCSSIEIQIIIIYSTANLSIHVSMVKKSSQTFFSVCQIKNTAQIGKTTYSVEPMIGRTDCWSQSTFDGRFYIQTASNIVEFFLIHCLKVMHDGIFAFR